MAEYEHSERPGVGKFGPPFVAEEGLSLPEEVKCEAVEGDLPVYARFPKPGDRRERIGFHSKFLL